MTDDHRIETYKSLITLSIEGFKYSILVNGGAAVALLAYLGKVVGRAGSAAPDMRMPMGAFLVGLLFCGFAMVSAYCTQLQLYQEVAGRDGGKGKHVICLRAAMICFVLSLAAFACGAWLAVVRFH